MTTVHWPSVDVVIPTHNRPEMLGEAIAAVRAQNYPGRLGVLVVFDRQEPDPALETRIGVSVRVMRNTRTAGLSGSRNTGILSSNADFVAFCDDDDVWLDGKLLRQVERVVAEPSENFVTTGIRVDFEGHRSPRFAGMSQVPHARLLESRMAMLHSSTFLIRRSYLVDQIGLVDEGAPGSQNEDYELLLRASADRPIAHVDEPLVAVRWGGTSMFARAWESKIASSQWILERYPAIATSRTGYARLQGQIAFAHAALQQRRQALRWAWRTQRTRPLEPRGYLAAAVAMGAVSSGRVLAVLHRRGRGI